MRLLKILFISFFLCVFSQVGAGTSIDLSILFTLNVQGELYPCG
jgi:hypothetical protein